MSKKLTTEEFIQRSSSIHKNKFDYSKTFYKNGKEKVTITCPIHGDFEQLPESHLRGIGCNKCAHLKLASARRSPKDKLLDSFKLHHNDKYNYPNFTFKTIADKIKIICPYHGEFLQTIAIHKNGGGCPECSNVKPHTTQSFVEKVSKIHNNKYDYSLVNYINNNTKVLIICPHHGVFEQIPRGHLKYGCPKCHLRGYSKDKWINIANKNKNSLLYIIRCYDCNEEFIKIGITTKSINYRFKSKELPYNYEPIIEFSRTPEMVWDFEKELHKRCKLFKYKPLKSFAGETECFTPDVLWELSDLWDS